MMTRDQIDGVILLFTVPLRKLESLRESNMIDREEEENPDRKAYLSRQNRILSEALETLSDTIDLIDSLDE